MKERARAAPESGPTLSVVVVTLAGPEYLRRCLTALQRQRGTRPAETLVPYDESRRQVADLAAEFPAVRFLPLEGDLTFSELRARGFGEARGEIIALTEDHCVPAEGWCLGILRGHRGEHAAVGGPVEPTPAADGRERTVDWAIYLTDFGRYLPPVQRSPTKHLTDCNVSYKRRALEDVEELWRDQFHETVVNGSLAGWGDGLLLSPDVLVRQQRSLSLGGALRERYAFGRLFGGTRARGYSRPRGAFMAAAAAILPFLITARAVGNVLDRGRYRGKLFRALPHIFLLAVAWAAGESLGYLSRRADRGLVTGTNGVWRGAA